MLCKFAEFYVQCSPFYPYTSAMIQKFKCEEEVDSSKIIKIGENLTLEKCAKYNEMYPNVPVDEAEHIFLANELFKKILPYKSIMIHSSAVKYKGKCYLFSAPSGTGKSTHTAIWERLYGDDVKIINDDKPIIRLMGDELIAYGSPFAGGTHKFCDDNAPLSAIVFITRSEENSIRKLTGKEALLMLFQETIRKVSKERMNLVLDMIDVIIKKVDLYELCCNTEDDSARIAHDTIVKD
ncbi:MAG: hypothetical protein ACI4HM_00750 [Ruminococcus sp.]